MTAIACDWRSPFLCLCCPRLGTGTIEKTLRCRWRVLLLFLSECPMKDFWTSFLVQWRRWSYVFTRYRRRREEFSKRTRAECWKHAWADLRRNETRILSHRVKQPVRASTRQKLYSMVGGDSALAERLILQARKDYPHLSEQEIWEQAIRNLERDRY